MSPDKPPPSEFECVVSTFNSDVAKKNCVLLWIKVMQGMKKTGKKHGKKVRYIKIQGEKASLKILRLNKRPAT